MIDRLRVQGYRSLRDLDLAVAPLTVVTGPNGAGKSNLYRALRLLVAAAEGGFARAIAAEGGMPSVVWAGGRSQGPVRLRIEVGLGDVTYALAAGFPQPPHPFPLDPMIKEEDMTRPVRGRRTPVSLLRRRAGSAFLRSRDGGEETYPFALDDGEAALSQLRDPHRYPEIAAIREHIRSWRFYHRFVTDDRAPARQPQVGTFTGAIGADGGDLAAALKTIQAIGNDRALGAALAAAFPDADLAIADAEGVLSIEWRVAGVRRAFAAAELSDGTLRYLCLLAALLPARPPPFLVLNEPEAALHPDLLPPLAALIAAASATTQVWVITHAERLAALIQESGDALRIDLCKRDGATEVAERPAA